MSLLTQAYLLERYGLRLTVEQLAEVLAIGKSTIDVIARVLIAFIAKVLLHLQPRILPHSSPIRQLFGFAGGAQAVPRPPGRTGGSCSRTLGDRNLNTCCSRTP